MAFCAGAAPDAMEKRVIAAVKRHAQPNAQQLYATMQASQGCRPGGACRPVHLGDRLTDKRASPGSSTWIVSAACIARPRSWRRPIWVTIPAADSFEYVWWMRDGSPCEGSYASGPFGPEKITPARHGQHLVQTCAGKAAIQVADEHGVGVAEVCCRMYAEVRKGELQNEGEAADKEKILAARPRAPARLMPLGCDRASSLGRLRGAPATGGALGEVAAAPARPAPQPAAAVAGSGVLSNSPPLGQQLGARACRRRPPCSRLAAVAFAARQGLDELLDGEVTPATKWDDLGFDDLDKAPRLPIAARGCDAGLLQADPSAAGVRGLSTPSRSRRAGPQSSPAASSPTPTQALLCADASGGASYREQLRASGKQALLQVREGARSAPKRAEPSPVALADQIAAPPFGAAHAAPAGARTPLTTRGFAAPLGGSPFATAADQQAPLVFVHPATGAAYAGPQAAPSPFALADVLALTPGSAGAPGVVSFHCPGGYQGCAVGPPAAVQHGGRGVPAEAQGFMVIAMATAPAVGSGMSQGLSGEELAAHLRAAAPDMYED
ncbi:unnamed protein product [Prorocentrum cordatum]|uniref:Uncharacterized protein n=1 Tax=Prorocentrum cordatum TaxID=2364126 RepID=A0ABN9UZS9_9DINO|nr:unnamed protein product [Polarella glacialis]